MTDPVFELPRGGGGRGITAADFMYVRMLINNEYIMMYNHKY